MDGAADEAIVELSNEGAMRHEAPYLQVSYIYMRRGNEADMVDLKLEGGQKQRGDRG